MKNTASSPQIARISNQNPILGRLIALGIAVTAIPIALNGLLNTSGTPTGSLITNLVIIASVITLGVIGIIITNTSRGALYINQEEKTFSLNNKDWHPYSDLKFYKSSLYETPDRLSFFYHQSRMYITVGLDSKHSFTVQDNNASMLRVQGIDEISVTLLESLIKGSSLGEAEKTSFENWAARARIANGTVS